MSRKTLSLAVVAALTLQLPVPAAHGTASYDVSPGYETSGPERPPVPPVVTELDLTAGRGIAQLRGRATPRFRLVGITWPRGAAGAVQAKVRVRQGGKWTGWQVLHRTDDHGPDPDSEEAAQAREGTDPLWVGRSDGVEAQLTSADGRQVEGAKVSLVEPGDSDYDEPAGMQHTVVRPNVAEPESSPAPYGMPKVITRRGWGADERLRAHNGAACTRPKYTRTVRVAFVHHTADSNRYTRRQAPALVRSIYAYHVKSNGWCDVGYSFIVDKFGQIYEGRYGGMNLPVLGAHTAKFNSDSFGVSLLGNYETAQPGNAIQDAAARVIAWKLDGNYRAPRGQATLNGHRFDVVSGHRDTKPTACPGRYVYGKLGSIRNRVAALMGYSVSTEIRALHGRLGGERVLGPPYWGEHQTYNRGRGTWFARRDLYWSRSTGAHSVFGVFRLRHRQFGHGTGPLGLPSGEQRAGRIRGSVVQHFRHKGTRAGLYWSRRTGAQASYGVIMMRYAALGEERSRLGLPVTSPYAIRGGLGQQFQHGRIAWLRASNKTSVTYW